jgi:hypothetical protein
MISSAPAAATWDPSDSALAGFSDATQPSEFTYVTTPCPFDYYSTVGTIGTKITIKGDDFGNKEGQVLIGDKKCKVFSWSDTKITGQIVGIITPPGKYDIIVEPKKGETQVCPEAFEVKAPELTGIKPIKQRCDNFYMTGTFFGTTKGSLKLYFEDEQGMMKKAKIFGYEMKYLSGESYGFFNIDLEPGTYKVKIQNKIGETFFPDGPCKIIVTDNCEILLDCDDITDTIN